MKGKTNDLYAECNHPYIEKLLQCQHQMNANVKYVQKKQD